MKQYIIDWFKWTFYLLLGIHILIILFIGVMMWEWQKLTEIFTEGYYAMIRIILVMTTIIAAILRIKITIILKE